MKKPDLKVTVRKRKEGDKYTAVGVCADGYEVAAQGFTIASALRRLSRVIDAAEETP